MRVWMLSLALGLSLHASNALAQGNAAMAQERFARGTTLYNQHDYPRALDEFQASVSLYGSPNTRLYIARCLRDMGRLDEAVSEYERASREAIDRAAVDPRYAATRDASQAEMLAILPRVARLTVNAPDLPVVATVRVNGRQIPREGLGVPMPVMPGRVEVVAEAQGYHPFRREITVAAAGEQSVRVDLLALPRIEGQGETPWQNRNRAAPPPPPSGLPRSVAYASFGVGAAGFVSFGVFALLANGRFNTLNTQCTGGPCTEADSDAISGGRALQTLTNVSLGVGLVGAAAGAIFFALARPTESAAAPPRPTVRVAMGTSGLTLDGVF